MYGFVVRLSNHLLGFARVRFGLLFKKCVHISSKTHEDFFKELIPEVLEIDPAKGWDEGDIIATQSIIILPGFKSKPGKSLYINVVPNKLTPIGL